MQALHDDFAKLAQYYEKCLEGKRFDALVDRYNAIDQEITNGMKFLAGTVISDFESQRSPKLIKAFGRIYLWTVVLSCVTQNTPLTDKVYKLSQRCRIAVPPRETLTRKSVLRILSAAQICKRCVIRDDAERRAKWLEGLALEASLDNPNTEWGSILKQSLGPDLLYNKTMLQTNQSSSTMQSYQNWGSTGR